MIEGMRNPDYCNLRTMLTWISKARGECLAQWIKLLIFVILAAKWNSRHSGSSITANMVYSVVGDFGMLTRAFGLRRGWESHPWLTPQTKASTRRRHYRVEEQELWPEHWPWLRRCIWLQERPSPSSQRWWMPSTWWRIRIWNRCRQD